MNDQLDIVNKHGEVIGQEELEKAHTKDLLHQAFTYSIDLSQI